MPSSSPQALASARSAARPPGQTVIDLIGNTPLLRLERLWPAGNLLAKAEWYNPGQSAKDRPAWRIIREAQRAGKLDGGKVLLDATSGNTGIAYAMIGAARRIPVCLCMPGSVTPARVRILKAYGAELVPTDPAEFSDGAIRKAQALYAAHPERYFYADQYSNESNWKAHFETTGPEIWAQTEGRVRHFVATLGTSGTFVGTSRFLKSKDASIQCVEIQPDAAFHGLEGMKHMDSSIVPSIYDAALADRKLAARTEAAYRHVVDLARMEGLLVGISSGAALEGALQVAREHPGEIVVTVFPDNGLKYLNEQFWDDTLRLDLK
jgi:cysteine synthase B